MYVPVHGGQQEEPSSAGDGQCVEGLLTGCSVQMCPRRQNLKASQFVIESIKHLQDAGFSCNNRTDVYTAGSQAQALGGPERLTGFTRYWSSTNRAEGRCTTPKC